jgi:hypothetical protein
VATSTRITERAAQQVDQLRKKQRRSYDQFLLALRAQGCASLNYRLSGDDLLSKICVAHLAGALRVVVAFSEPNVATILLVGPHDDQDPFVDVYSQLYELAGLAEPPAAERTKPPCCEITACSESETRNMDCARWPCCVSQATTSLAEGAATRTSLPRIATHRPMNGR